MLILTLPHPVLFCCLFSSGFCNLISMDCNLSFPFLALLFSLMGFMSFCPGGFSLLVWMILISVCPILNGYVCSWTLTTFWMVRVTPPAHSSLLLG